MTNSAKIITALIIFIITSFLFTIFHYRENNHYLCKQCFSQKSTSQYFLGDISGDLSFPVFPKQSSTKMSFIYIDFKQDFFVGHQHNWALSHSSYYQLFGLRWAGCGLGDRRMNSFVYNYEERESFRMVVHQYIEQEKMTSSDLFKILFMSESEELLSLWTKLSLDERLVLTTGKKAKLETENTLTYD